MSGGALHQFFGPSPRHDRACIELRFAMDGEKRSLAPLAPLLADLGFRLNEEFGDDPLPLDQAVCRLTYAMLSRHAPWWARHGQDEQGGWAAIAHPVPSVAGSALQCALALSRSSDGPSPALASTLRALSTWLDSRIKTRMRLAASAELLGLSNLDVSRRLQIHQIGQSAKGLHFSFAANQRDAMTGSILGQDKDAANALMKRFGLPTTRAITVTSDEQAIRALQSVGYPCVVKPMALGQGVGVSTQLRTQEQALAALAHVRRVSRGPAIVENHVVGYDHRLLVSNGDLLWAYRRLPASVVGDGRATVAQLIERENRRRASLRLQTDAYLHPIDCDESVERLLRDRHGLTLTSVLDDGVRLEVVGPANTARGGEIEDVTGIMHPDNHRLAVTLSRLFRIGTIGVDFITPDISRSWRDVDCAVIEVNRSPATSGVGDTTAHVRAQFPNRLSGRVPTVAVVGSSDFRAVMVERIEAAFQKRGRPCATANYVADGFPDRHPARPRDMTGPLDRILLDPEVEAIVVSCGTDETERAGLPLPGCDLLLIEDKDRFAWLSPAAGDVLSGRMTPSRVATHIGKLVDRYGDPAEGGPIPVLEPVHTERDTEFRLKVWRSKAMPRAWFWNQIGCEPPLTSGLTTHTDLLAAVRSLAAAAPGVTGRLAGEFSHEELIGGWFRVTFEASIELPRKQPGLARAALLAATERVNQVIAAKMVRLGGDA